MLAAVSSPNSFDRLSLIPAFAHLFRLPVGLLAALAGCATIHALNPATSLLKYFLTALTLVCMMSAACAINDYWDLAKDRIDHPDRPLPSGKISPQQARWAADFLFGTSLAAALPLGFYPLILVAVCIVLLWNYSHLLLYNGIIGNLIVATIIASLVLLGSFVAEQPLAMLYPTVFLFCYALAKEVIWDTHDAAGDRSQGIVTIANQWGDDVAFTIVWILLGLLLISMPIGVYLLPMSHPLLFAAFALSTVLVLSAALMHYQQQRSLHSYQTFIAWERLSMALGVLALFAAAPSPS